MGCLRFIANFFREGTPESLNRLLVFLIVLNGLAMAWVTLVLDEANATDALMIGGGICAIAGGWKGWQKSQELKNRKSNEQQ